MLVCEGATHCDLDKTQLDVTHERPCRTKRPPPALPEGRVDCKASASLNNRTPPSPRDDKHWLSLINIGRNEATTALSAP